jgi:hypothetical protein
MPMLRLLNSARYVVPYHVLYHLKYGPSSLIFGMTAGGRPIHIQSSYPSRSIIKIITLYEPDPVRWIDFKKKETRMSQYQDENLVERLVTYTLEFEGKFYIIKDVPARANDETGEQFFSPITVERLHRTILGHAKPRKIIETPVYEYTEAALQ